MDQRKPTFYSRLKDWIEEKKILILIICFILMIGIAVGIGFVATSQHYTSEDPKLFLTELINLDTIQLTSTEGPVPETIEWNENNWASSCSFQGNNLNFLSNKTRKECHPNCALTTSCTHFNWTPTNGGTCYLKSGSVSKENATFTKDPQIFCGVLPPLTTIEGLNGRGIKWFKSKYGVWSYGCKFSGVTIETKPTDESDCNQVCHNREGCTHFNQVDDQCELKRGWAGKGEAVVIDDITAICGTL